MKRYRIRVRKRQQKPKRKLDEFDMLLARLDEKESQ